MQLCGWMWTETLWPGGMSNSDYNTEAEYLEEEHESQKLDKINNEIITITNIYGKGYHSKIIMTYYGYNDSLTLNLLIPT